MDPRQSETNLSSNKIIGQSIFQSSKHLMFNSGFPHLLPPLPPPLSLSSFLPKFLNFSSEREVSQRQVIDLLFNSVSCLKWRLKNYSMKLFSFFLSFFLYFCLQICLLTCLFVYLFIFLIFLFFLGFSIICLEIESFPPPRWPTLQMFPEPSAAPTSSSSSPLPLLSI